MMFIAVDLPEPLAPMIATNSPRRDREIDAVERAHLGVARAVDLRDGVEGYQRLARPRPSLAGPRGDDLRHRPLPPRHDLHHLAVGRADLHRNRLRDAVAADT